MRYGRKMKRETKLVIISVLILTLSTLRFSYSAFFSVESQSTIQQISTGVLDVIIDNTASHAIQQNTLFPTSESKLPKEETASVEGSYALLTLTNKGTLDADFSITLGYDILPVDKTEENLLSFDYLNVGIYDVTKGIWTDFGDNTYYTKVSSLTPSEENVYPILRDIINKNEDMPITRQFRIYVWLAEDTPISEIGKLVYLKIDVKSAAVNDYEE